MPSAFAHALVPVATALGAGKNLINRRLLCVAVFCAVMPDLDVIAFKFGIPYASQWGHRGFTHSIVFALLVAAVALALSSTLKCRPQLVFGAIFLATVSHPLLDMLTNGGLGVALYWPFSNERVFFPIRPIAVSPIGVARFFSEQGLIVLKSELLWVGLPSLALYSLLRLVRRYQ